MKSPLLRPKEVFAITINPNDTCQYYPKNYPSTWKTRLKEFKDHWNKRFIELFSLYDVDYYLPIEVSEPFRTGEQKDPRIHFHGIIRFKDESAVMQYLLCTHHYLMKWCNIKIDKLQDQEEWIEYMEKHNFLPFGVLENVPPNYDCYLEYFFPNSYLFLPDDGEEYIE